MRILVAVSAVTVFAVAACKPADSVDPVETGRRVYLANCIACHNADPAKDGNVGPAVAGSPADLVEARVMRAQYPPGYTPKRTTQLMPAQPFLSDAVPSLAAYLGSLPRAN